MTHQSPGMKRDDFDSELEIVAEVSGNKLTFFLFVDLELIFRALYPPTPLSSPLLPKAGFLPQNMQGFRRMSGSTQVLPPMPFLRLGVKGGVPHPCSALPKSQRGRGK
jgi:hypothetical protein